MANDNHLLSVTCYNVTMLNTKYYNDFFELGQQKINFSFYELSLPDDDPVYTLKKVCKLKVKQKMKNFEKFIQVELKVPKQDHRRALV